MNGSPTPAQRALVALVAIVVLPWLAALALIERLAPAAGAAIVPA